MTSCGMLFGIKQADITQSIGSQLMLCLCVTYLQLICYQ